MPHHALKVWKETRGSGTPRVVCSFFHGLTCTLTGGRESSSISEGDVVLKDYSAFIEVKGTGSDHAIRLDQRQIDRHAKRTQTFPFDNAACYFFLYRYSTRESKYISKQKRPPSLIRSNVVNGTGYEFLAARTRRLWVVPLPTIQQLASQDGGHSRLLFPAMRDAKGIWGLSLARKDLQLLEERVPFRQGVANVRFSLEKGKRIASRFQVTHFDPDARFELSLKNVVWE